MSIFRAPWLIDYALDALGHGRDGLLREQMRNSGGVLELIQRGQTLPPTITFYTVPSGPTAIEEHAARMVQVNKRVKAKR